MPKYPQNKPVKHWLLVMFMNKISASTGYMTFYLILLVVAIDSF